MRLTTSARAIMVNKIEWKYNKCLLIRGLGACVCEVFFNDIW